MTENSVGGNLTLGTENPNPDVIEGWNFKVAGTQTTGIGSQSLDLNGLVPFVQLIGLYDDEEIDKLLGRDTGSFFQRRVSFTNESSDSGAYEFETESIKNYTERTQEQIQSFEQKIIDKYIKIFITNDRTEQEKRQRRFQGINARQGYVEKNGIILATNSPQAGNEAYEIDENGIDTPKDSGGVGITDLQVETGTKDFLNRRYKLRLTITDPQVLNDKPEYLKLASLQSKFLIIYGWSNPEVLTSWPEDFVSAPAVTEVGTPDYKNGYMVVDISNTNTGGAWNASIVATTMYDFAFNEVGQLEASFTFMPREISFMNTIRMPTVAPLIKRVLGSGSEEVEIDTSRPDSRIPNFFGYADGVGNVISELGKNLAQIIEEEQNAYVGGNPLLRDIWSNIDEETALTDKLAEWSENFASPSNANIEEFYERQRQQQQSARFPYAGVGHGTYLKEELPIPEGENESPGSRITSRINYYYLGWVLEAMRFSLWDLNRGRAMRSETPYDLKFRYMGVPSNSMLNYAINDELTPSIIPSLKNYTAEAMRVLLTRCVPRMLAPYSPPRVDWSATPTSSGQLNILFEAVTRDHMNRTHNPLTNYGFAYLESIEGWHNLSDEQKIEHIPDGDWRKSLMYSSSTGLRIMHPKYENQYLYNMIPNFGGDSWVSVNNNLGSPRVFNWPKGHGPLKIEYDESRHAVKGDENNIGTGALDDVGVGDISNRGIRGAQGIGPNYNQYIGQGIFTYINEGEIKKIISAEEVNGDTLESNWQTNLRFAGAFGVIMPAVTARPYKEDSYIKLQQEWYNIHIAYLHQNFENIIRNRIDEALQEGKTIQDLAAEPVDLFWLTGKKYVHVQQEGFGVADSFVKNADVGTGRKRRSARSVGENQAAALIYHAQGEGLWGVNESKEHAGEVLLQQNAIEISQFEEELVNVRSEIVALESRLSDPTPIVDEDARTATETLVLHDDQVFGSIEEFGAADNTKIDNLLSAEDTYVQNVVRGSQSVKLFWEERMKIVFRDLMAKDLIAMEEAQYPDNEQDFEYTLSSKYVAPPNIRNLPNKPEGESPPPFIYYFNSVGRPPTPAPTTVNYNVRLTDFYIIVVVNPNITMLQSDAHGEYFTEGRLGGWQSYTHRAFLDGEIYSLTSQEVTDPQHHTRPPIYNPNWQERIATGYTRVVKWGGLDDFQNHYVGLPGGSFDIPHQQRIDGANQYPNPDTIIDDIGFFDKEGVGYTREREQGFLGDINPDQFRSRVETAKLLGNDSYNNYVFMNLCDEQLRENYTYAVDIKKAIDNGDRGLEQQWTAAVDQYESYLNNCKTLLKRYIAKIGEANEIINEIMPLLLIKRADETRIEEEINQFQEIFDMMNNTDVALSPFGEGTELDVTVNMQLGGGRTMALRGSKAQQIALRFSKKMEFGAGDIQNYGPPKFGLDYSPPNSRFYGWTYKGVTGGESGAQEIGLEGGSIPDPVPWYSSGEVGIFPAQLQNSAGRPVQIATFGPNDILGQKAVRDVTLDQPAIKKLFYEKYKEQITGGLFEDTGGPHLVGGDMQWPTWYPREVSRVGGRLGDLEWCLWVDDDLDFIVPYIWVGGDNKYRNAGLLDQTPYSWVKIPYRFGTKGTTGAETIYPNASGARIGQNEHLPNLKENAVRSLVRTTQNGFGGYAAQNHPLNGPWTINGAAEEGNKQSAALSSAANIYAGNPRLAYLGDDNAKNGQSAVTDSYESMGRPSASTTYPYGYPPDVEVPLNLRAFGTPEVIVDETALGELGRSETINTMSDSYDGSDIRATVSAPHYGSYWPMMKSTAIAINNILTSLPLEFEGGYFSSVKGADSNFEGGEELNQGVKEWIFKYLINLLPAGRRIGIQPHRQFAQDGNQLVGNYERNNWFYTVKQDIDGDDVDETVYYGRTPLDMATRSDSRIRDVVYGDLFDNVEMPIDSSNDFGNKIVHNVAEIPIKREVVDNLLNRRNTNMSMMQFVQQLIAPSSIGVAGNVQIAGRNRNGIMELAVASIDYKGITDDLIRSANEVTYGSGSTLPTDQLLFDYKIKNSLIENIDMSSKMDPAAFLTYQNSSSMIHGPGRDYNVLKLLSFEGIAEDFKEYLEGVGSTSDSGQSYSGIVNIDMGNNVIVDRVRYSQLPATILDGFVANNPERWSKITSMMQGVNDFTTDLLAFYMRSVTLTVHGLTNVEPFNLIHVKGVLPNLEGIYIVTNITDKVVPTGFQTIIEGKLLRKEKTNGSSN